MKSLARLTGHAGLTVAFSLLMTACNPDEFYPTEEFLTGEDAFCFMARDLHTCQQLADRCQPAYQEGTPENQEPVFALCIGNPVRELGNDSTSNEGTGTDSVADGNTGSTGGDQTTTPGSGLDSRPSLADVYASNCKVDEKYLWVKRIVSKKQNTKMSKVKICHHAKTSAHSIVIACPALKAHLKHQDKKDYLGACEL